MNQYEDPKTALNKVELITAANITNRATITRKQKWEENNCMSISTHKLAKSHMERPGHGYERETL